MKKTPALITAALLAFGGVAMAQGTSTYHGTDSDRTVQRDSDARHHARDESSHAGEKAKGSMHRLGEKTRNALHRMGNAFHREARRDDDSATHGARRSDGHDTRAMGAAAESSEVERARQQRMDDSYANWKRREQR